MLRQHFLCSDQSALWHSRPQYLANLHRPPCYARSYKNWSWLQFRKTYVINITLKSCVLEMCAMRSTKLTFFKWGAKSVTPNSRLQLQLKIDLSLSLSPAVRLDPPLSLTFVIYLALDERNWTEVGEPYLNSVGTVHVLQPLLLLIRQGWLASMGRTRKANTKDV
jgi:hypothetical protein